MLRDEVELKALAAKIIALGKGEHLGTNGEKVVVVGATAGSPGKVTFELATDKVADAKKIAGEEFGKLFTRSEVFTPCASFSDVVPKVITPARSAKLIELCQVTGQGSAGKGAYLLYPTLSKPSK